MSRTTLAVAPKRQRGRLRVDAILKAGARLFSESGFDGTTMTEIAAQSGTAIGSLYRFFPTKESLAEALILHYGEQLFDGFDRIALRCAELSGEQLADALVDLMLDLRQDRSAAVALLDAQKDASGRRAALRGGTIDRIGAILRTHNPRLSGEASAAMALVLLQILKSVPVLASEQGGQSALLIAEVRRMVGLYVSALR